MKTAVLSLESQAPIASVDRRLFGSFLEHLGRAVYTGIYQPAIRQRMRRGSVPMC